MGEHKIKTIEERGMVYGTCTCRAQSPLFRHDWQVEDWGMLHRQAIERIRTHLENKNPRLEKSYEWYRHKADDPETPEGDRPIWKQLADEIGHRLNIEGSTDDDQPTLL